MHTATHTHNHDTYVINIFFEIYLLYSVRVKGNVLYMMAQQCQPGSFSFQPADIRYMHHLLSPAATALFWQHVQPVEFMKEIPAVTLVKKFPKFS